MEWPGRSLQILRIDDGDDCVLAITGALDMATAATVTDAVANVCSDGASSLTFDLRELTFMDSTGLRALLAPAME